MPRRFLYKSNLRAVSAFALTVSLALGLTSMGFAGERKPSGDGKTTSPQTTKGFVVNLDPTGKPIQSVPVNLPNKAAGSRHEGLVVEQNPAGGITVDLKGRFQRAMTAKKDTQGNIRVECQPAETAVSEQKTH